MTEPNDESKDPAASPAESALARSATTRPAAAAVAALAMLLLAAWAAFAAHDEFARARWDSFTPTPEAPLFADLDSLRSPDALVESGRTLEHDLFPARYEEAAALYARAIAVDPLSAGAWFGLAHARLMRGEFEAARAALERSDELDPHYPRRRHASIAMWAALGEPERGLDAARRLARLGGRYRAEAGARLAEGGVPPATIARELTRDAGPLAEEDRVSLAEAIAPATPAELEEVAGVLGLASVLEPGPLERAAILAADPLAFDLAFALCRARDPLGESEPLAGRLATTDPGLARFSPEPPFPFGWMRIRARAGLEVFWKPPTASLAALGLEARGKVEQQGTLEFVLSPDLRREDFRAPILRIPARAGGGVRLALMMRQQPPQSRPASLVVRGADGRGIARTELVSLGGMSERVHLDLPASDRDETLEIVLVVPAAPADRAATETRVHVGGIESLEPLDHPEVGATDASDEAQASKQTDSNFGSMQAGFRLRPALARQPRDLGSLRSRVSGEPFAARGSAVIAVRLLPRRGCVSKPGVAHRATPGDGRRGLSTPQGLRSSGRREERNPFRVEVKERSIPGVAPSSQPRAPTRNPFGVVPLGSLEIRSEDVLPFSRDLAWWNLTTDFKADKRFSSGTAFAGARLHHDAPIASSRTLHEEAAG